MQTTSRGLKSVIILVSPFSMSSVEFSKGQSALCVLKSFIHSKNAKSAVCVDGLIARRILKLLLRQGKLHGILQWVAPQRVF